MIPITKNPRHLEASKWLSKAVLADEEELESLFLRIKTSFKKDPFFISLGSAVKKDEIVFSKDVFLNRYSEYVNALKEGLEPGLQNGAEAWTLTEESVVFQELAKDKYMAAIVLPVVQVRPHRLLYSREEKKFRSKLMGQNGISWGLEFSFPQIYINSETEEVCRSGPDLLNFHLFKEIEKWIREETLPTPLFAENQLHNIPARIGKKALLWAANHPDLKREGIVIQQ